MPPWIAVAEGVSDVLRAVLEDRFVHRAFGRQLLFSAGAALVEALAREEPHPWPALDACEMPEAARTAGKVIQHRKRVQG